MASDDRPIRMFSAAPPDFLAKDRPARKPSNPDEPWVTGVTECTNTATGQVLAVDLGIATEARIRERFGDGADQVLNELERIRPTMNEANFGFALGGIAQMLIYDD